MKAAIYCRYSTARQDARSLDDQRRRCSEFIAARGWTAGPTYEDAEVSGTQLDRPGLDRLRQDAARKTFQVIVVDDLSRLSRDLGTGWSLIFTEFDGYGVVVADVMTGMVSTDPAAKMTFATLGLVNMMTVEGVKHQTRRGLDSRARAGFHTGGPCYGYRTEDEPNATDPKHVRKVLVVHEPEAEIVREIFVRWIDGESFRPIAEALNDRGVPAPRTGSKKAPGWGATTIRYVLTNKRYRGEFTWNTRRYVKDPVSGKRKPLPRPAQEHVTVIRPELAIVDSATFAAASKRFKTTAGRPEGTTTRHPPHPLKGLIKCGVCGGGMTIYTRRTTGKAVHTLVRCSRNTDQGEKGCPNKFSVSVERVIDTLYDSVLESQRRPERLAALVDAVLASYTSEPRKDPSEAVRADLAAAKARTKNLLDAIAQLGVQPDLAARYREEQARVSELETELANVRPPAAIPTRADILRVLDGMDTAGARNIDPDHVAAQLRARFERVEMEPSEDGGWEVRGVLRCPAIQCSGGKI